MHLQGIILEGEISRFYPARAPYSRLSLELTSKLVYSLFCKQQESTDTSAAKPSHSKTVCFHLGPAEALNLKPLYSLPPGHFKVAGLFEWFLITGLRSLGGVGFFKITCFLKLHVPCQVPSCTSD